MVPAGAAWSVDRRDESRDHARAQRSSQSRRQSPGGIDAVAETTGERSRNRHHRESWQPGSEDTRDQRGVVGEAAVLEVVDQDSCRPNVVKRGQQRNPAGQNPVRGRAHETPASLADEEGGRWPVTCLA